MKLSTVVIVSWLIGNVQHALSRPSGNVCQIPEGPFEKSCTNIAVEFCQNMQYALTPCKLTAECDPDGQPPYNYSTHNTFLLPSAITYFNVINNNGFISHPFLDKITKNIEIAEPIECNPCLLPVGNYKESCTKISITYLPWLNDTEAPCLFQADCQKDMRRNEYRHHIYPHSKDSHNEAMLPKHVLFSEVKNLHGTLIHPSAEFIVATNQCYERRSTEEVAVSQASRFNAERHITGIVMGAGLALVLNS